MNFPTLSASKTAKFLKFDKATSSLKYDENVPRRMVSKTLLVDNMPLETLYG